MEATRYGKKHKLLKIQSPKRHRDIKTNTNRNLLMTAEIFKPIDILSDDFAHEIEYLNLSTHEIEEEIEAVTSKTVAAT